jgi:hypothetical protein
MSREPCTEGWCGETNNISVEACGVVEVTAAGRIRKAPVEKIIQSEEMAE